MEQKRIAVVTGASGGLGREFVKLLIKDTRLDEIWALARRQDKLEDLQKELGEKIRIFSVDLGDQQAILQWAEQLSSTQILYLINNAGYAKFCSYADLSVEESVNMIEVNCCGVVSMGLVCIPFMPPGSHIINIASQASFQPLPYQNIYSSTKAFVRNYSRALNVELKDKNICVTAVCPGWIQTGLYDRALIGAKKATHDFHGMVTPDKVAQKALQDANRNRDISVYSFYTKFSHLVAKILPQKQMIRLWLRQQKLSK